MEEYIDYVIEDNLDGKGDTIRMLNGKILLDIEKELILKNRNIFNNLINIEKQLLELSSKITGIKQLIENGLNTDDDLVLIDELGVQARELAEQRKELKSNI